MKKADHELAFTLDVKGKEISIVIDQETETVKVFGAKVVLHFTTPGVRDDQQLVDNVVAIERTRIKPGSFSERDTL